MHAAEGGVSALISEISKTESVTKEEFTAFLKANKMTDEMDSEEVSGLFDSMDTNSNGEITKVEFAKWFGENKDVEERLHLQAKSEFAEFEEVEEDVLSQVKKLRVEAFLDHTSRPYVESTEVWRGTSQHTNWPVYIYIHTYIYMCVNRYTYLMGVRHLIIAACPESEHAVYMPLCMLTGATFFFVCV